jgi:peptidoglycan/LPS O-acetylase OafA/YrhL
MGGPTTRLLWLDLAKGLGMALVVFGHVIAGSAPPDHAWAGWCTRLIYLFHMPFFMLVSGCTSFAFTKPFSGWEPYRGFVWKRFLKLMVPHAIFAAIVFLAKSGAAGHARVDNSLSSDSRFWDVWTKPMSSYSVFLWYIYVLFLLTLVVPFLRKWSSRGLVGLLVASFLLWIPHWTPGMKATGVLKPIVEHLPFFLAGGLLARLPNFRVLRWGWLALPLFALLAWRGWGFKETPAYERALMGVLGTCFTLPLCLGLAERAESGICRLFVWIGGFAFPIYLMNTLAIGGAKGILTKFLPWGGWQFYFLFPALFFAGLLLPILGQTQFIERIPGLRKILSR